MPQDNNKGSRNKIAKGPMPKGKAKIGPLGSVMRSAGEKSPYWVPREPKKKSSTPRSQMIAPRNSKQKSSTPRSQMIAPRKRKSI